MKFRMNNQDLLEGLNTVTRALSARPAKQILEGVLIVADDNRVNLTCSDGSLSIEYTSSADVQESGQIVLPGRLFSELIRKMPGGDVELTCQNNRSASIRCQKARSNLATMNAAEYPEIMMLKSPTPVKIPQKKLKDMISHVSFAIATDESRQIQPFELPEGQEMMKAILPGKVINELSRILPEDDAFCTLLFDQGRMQCTFGNIRMSSVLLAGEYIDYRRIIPTAFRTHARADRGTVSDAIDRASLMAREGKNNLIKMSFRSGSLRITSNAEMGDVEEEMEADLQGDDIDIELVCKMADHFLQQGFTYFDTAYPYHNGFSERAVKKVLVERHPRESFLLADKMPVYKLKEPQDALATFEDIFTLAGSAECLFELLGQHRRFFDRFDRFLKSVVTFVEALTRSDHELRL